MSGGFRDEDEDFGDLLSRTSAMSSSHSPWSTPSDATGLVEEDLSSNPFADMQSSSVYVPAAMSSYIQPEPAPSSMYTPSSPPAASMYDPNPYATTQSSAPRAFSRESAPEPETPAYNRRGSSSTVTQNYSLHPTSAASPPASPPFTIPAPADQTPFGSPPASPTSGRPSVAGAHGRGRSAADMAALLGEEKPILPTFRKREASATGTSGKGSVLPVSSIGKRNVDGPLAALLGLAGDDQLVQSKPKPAAPAPKAGPTPPATTVSNPAIVASEPSPAPQSVPPPPAEEAPMPPASIAPIPPPLVATLSSASVTPLPPSPSTESPDPNLLDASLTRRPSLSPSNTSATAYESMVSPLDTGDADVNGWPSKDLSSDAGELDKKLAGLKVADEDDNDVTPSASGSLPPSTQASSTPPSTTITLPASPQSPFAAMPTSPTRQGIFDSAPLSSSSNANRGLRSYNGSMDESGGFGGGMMDDNDSLRGNYSRSVEVDTEDAFVGAETETATGVSSPATERDESMRNVPLGGVDNRLKSGMTSPPLPSVPIGDDASTEIKSLAPAFIITVGDPQKIGSSLNVAAQHTVYTVRTQTTSSAFRKPEFSVLRRFSHFLWLFDALTANNPGVIVPGMPEKSALGRFGSEFVENRRSALQAALMKIVSHPMLVGDPDLRLFLESDSFSVEIKQRRIETPAESKGFLASIGSSITGPKFVEFDDFFDERRLMLDTFEAQLRSVLTSFASAAKVRSAFQLSMGELQSALLGLSQCDLSGPLRHALEQAANLQRRLREISEQQSQSEEQIGGLTSVMEGYARLCGSVKLVFGARIKSYHTWQAADLALKKAKANHEKAKKSGRTHSELLGLSLADIAEAERKMLDSKRDFEDVSKLTKAEMARFDKEKIEDFKKAVAGYVEGMVVRQREVVRLWQEYQEVLQRAAGSNSQLALPAPEPTPASEGNTF